MGIGATESTDMAKNMVMVGGAPCCSVLLRVPAVGAERFQAAAERHPELILPRGHLCIFLPKYHPELNFIERYWSRVKWHARRYSDGSVRPGPGRGGVRPGPHPPLLTYCMAVGGRVPQGPGRRPGELGGAQVEVPPLRDWGSRR